MQTIDLSSQITLTIRGTGNKYILKSYTQERYTYVDIMPDEIIVNGISQEEKGKIAYNLDQEENIVIIKWNTPLTNCENMFRV